MSKHNIVVIATALGDVGGRIDYATNPDRQERLEAVYHSIDDETFWSELASFCQEQAKYSKSKHAVEAREWMVPLANELAEMYDPALLARMASERIKEITGTENVVGIHWNKTERNYHMHVISAENKEINMVKEGAILRQNTYYDADGKRSTKKECCDQDGNLKPGCEFYKKGERRIQHIRFSPKIDEIGSKAFLQDLKRDMANWQNELLNEDRFRVFDPSLFIAEQHIGPRDKQDKMPAELVDAIEAKNQLVRAYNSAVDECLSWAALRGTLQQELALMRDRRRDVKKHAKTSNWEKAIKFHLERIELRAAEWTEIFRNLPHEPENGSEGLTEAVDEPKRKESLLDQIAAADAVKGSQNRSEGRRRNNSAPPGGGDDR